MNDERVRCAQRVFADAWGARPCSNYAKPGDTLCGVHRRKADPIVAEPSDALTRPAVRSVLRKTIWIELAWAAGDGPRFNRPYYDAPVCWDRLSVKVELPAHVGSLDVSVGGTGFEVKSDGTVGKREVLDRGFPWDALPAAVQEDFRHEIRIRVAPEDLV